MDSTYWSLFRKNRKLYQWRTHGLTWVQLISCSAYQWHELFSNSTSGSSFGMNCSFCYSLVEKKENRIFRTVGHMVSRRLLSYEIYGRIFPYSRCSNWLYTRMMDDPRAYLFTHDDCYFLYSISSYEE